MANSEMHQMEKRGFNTKSLALVLRLGRMARDYLFCKLYENALISDEADFFKRVKYGEFISPDDEKTGMLLMYNSIEKTNRLVDNYLSKTEDKVNEKVGTLIDKVAKDFIAISIGYEIKEWKSRK